MFPPKYLAPLCFLLFSYSLGKALQTTNSGDNLALNKKVSLYPIPNYPDCADASDDLQLTDGILTKGRYWMQKSSVGWTFYHPRIVIDLGKIEPIREVILHTVGGGEAGVYLPKRIKVYVSDNNKDYHLVSTIRGGAIHEDGTEHSSTALSTGDLKARGRYVLVQLTPRGSMVFSDEIEVLKGNFDPETIQFNSQPEKRDDLVYLAYGMAPETYQRGHFPESPHTTWATPLSKGPLKAIILNFSDDMRDVVEIAQRVDMDYVPVSHWSYYNSGNNPPQTLPLLSREQIEQALPKSNLMVVGLFQWKHMPKDLLEKILHRVREGMGLIICTPGKDSPWIQPILNALTDSQPKPTPKFLETLPYELIPGYHRPKEFYFDLRQLGKGRIAIVDSSRFTRATHGLLPTFELSDFIDDTNGPLEYYFAAFAKLMIWAAGEENERITAVRVSPEHATIEMKPGKNPAILKATLRDPFFRPTPLGEATVPAEGGTFEFKLPAMPHGAVSVDVELCDAKDKILDFASGFFKNERKAHIEKILSKKRLFAAGEPIKASVTTTGDLSNLTLSIRLLDSYGREVAPMTTLPISEATTNIEIPYPNPLSQSLRMFATLQQGDAILDEKMERFWVDKPVAKDFMVLGWYALNGQPGADFCMKLLRELGIDGFVALPHLRAAQNGAYRDVRFGPEEIAPLRPESQEGSLELENCPNKPAQQTKLRSRLTGLAKDFVPYGVMEWSIGDEETLGKKDYCVCNDCLVAFREYLKGQYPSLEALNTSWGSTFASWDNVRPSRLEEINPKESVGSWLDHRRFMESVFADYHKHARDIVTKEIPEARVGLSGTPDPTSRNGYDWWKVMQAVNHLSGYGGIQVALQRSLMQPGTFFTTFLGYDYGSDDEEAARSAPWKLLFDGANGINYYTLISHTLNCPVIRPDLSMTPHGKLYFEQIKELKNGFGKLIMEANRENSGVAIHYSPASLHVATATGVAGKHDPIRDFNQNTLNLCQILTDLHQPFDFIHEEQMAQGALSKYKVLFLPWSSAISAREEKAIREFVAGGGTVIADSFCAVRDEHGKPHLALDDLFGVRQSQNPPEVKPRQLTFEAAPFENLEILAIGSGSKNLELAGGTALGRIGNAPALIFHKTGKGKTFFLNGSLARYTAQFSGGIAGEIQVAADAARSFQAPIRTFVASLLKEENIENPVRVTSSSHDPAEVGVATFTLRDTKLITLTRKFSGGPVDEKDGMTVKIHLAKPVHVYDSRGRKYFGEVSEFEDLITTGTPKIYALFPYKVEKIILTGMTDLMPGTIGKFQAEVRGSQKVGDHILHVSILDPSGRERPEYAGNYHGREGKAEIEIPFAYNDSQGEWIISVRDVASGVTASLPVHLKVGDHGNNTKHP